MYKRQALAIQASQPDTLVVAYAHTNPGYIPHASALTEGGYEVDVAYRPYGLLGPFSPDTAARLEEAALTLLSEAR